MLIICRVTRQVLIRCASYRYCQEVKGQGFVYGHTMIGHGGQMFFVPDEPQTASNSVEATKPDQDSKISVQTDNVCAPDSVPEEPSPSAPPTAESAAY